jgi:protein-export membrane protein SecD
LLGLGLAGCNPQPDAKVDPPVVEAPKPAGYLVLEAPGAFDDALLDMVKRRIDNTGLVEVTIQKQGDNRIRVDVPGVDAANLDKLIDLLTRQGMLTFNLVDINANPADYEAGKERNGRLALPDDSSSGKPLVVFVDPVITGTDLSDAKSAVGSSSQPVIQFSLHPPAAQRFAKATEQGVGKQLAIVIDEHIVSAPVIRDPITGGAGEITGNFTKEEVENLAIVLRSGALPVKLKVIERGIAPN